MQTQQGKILNLLKQRGQKGVANYEFSRMHILRYSARMKELRQEGHNIVTERDHLPNGRATNVFRYILIEPEQVDRVRRPRRSMFNHNTDGMAYIVY